jgi:2-polyprenyl-3-methyl-5-hydroxy-6-metoxy-1,4-benzoquinol methylase
MHPDTAARLVEINREFYNRFGDAFSATRHRIQPGVRRVLNTFKGDEAILDLGCGNGELARELANRGHRGPYLGVDFSVPLLRDAQVQPQIFSAKFLEMDLTQLATNKSLLKSKSWDVITAFAVLHHIPSEKMRLAILRTVHDLLAADGAFVLSNWQFLNSEKLKRRIKSWDVVDFKTPDIDAGDYLLDWRGGGEGLRYVHHFSEAELSTLAHDAGFSVSETFYSDGETGNLGLYQTWRRG